ncbi:MAG: isoamylase early set domain-containing protein [candidate division NC10 bacterium]|nr:isoamylase early set domain-containing protein [candidate division NC10 bacterium]MBI2163180.1 isoamylase early set domain-containing protein [candidate division NC10 bacterium]MBI2456787.1 isoamylase early set domain-containing protein [candidate division NC10 bacterium]MBI3086072.1 isoamylase early set domain-containing protein [candidate division NC10 bacterium]MBI3122235.1 isoamylase early set domain-containing protein [candidate division NC10 bacterium]
MARIKFRFENREAKTVALAGDFNGWSTIAHPMKRGRDRIWTIEMDIPPGRHEYKFLVNGEAWWNDPDAPKVQNVWGTENSYVDVQ